MTNYMKWLVRARIMAFTGAAFLLVPTLPGFEFTIARLGLRTTAILMVIGICLLIVGVLDGFGLIQRSWVKAAIREENERMRSGS